MTKSPEEMRRITEEMAEKVSEHINQLSGKPDKLYYVGGCVRDEVMGKTPNDFDLITTMYRKDYKEMFNAERIAYRAGNVHVVFAEVDGEIFETAALNAGETIEENLKNRDITMNAMAIDILTGELLDPTGGQDDIKHHIIRATQHTIDLLEQGREPVRVARIIGFCGRTGWELDAGTKSAMMAFADKNDGMLEMTHYQEERCFGKARAAGGGDIVDSLLEECGLYVDIKEKKALKERL